MTRFNTENPLGSHDPRDLSDNAKNLDEAVNSTDPTFTDRFGVERVTVAGGVDPSGFAQSALSDANRAESEANRAESARDAAFINADVYDDVAAGLASGDTQFQVVEGAEVVRYRRIDAENADEVARYPESEFVRIALDVASQPGLVSGEFYADDSEQPVYSITDEDGQALAAWDQQGEMDATPSLDMAEKSQRTRGEFYTADDQPAFALTDEEGRPLYAVDENGQPIVPFISEFHTEDGQPAYAWTDKNGVIFYGIDEEGRNVVGGGDGADLSGAPTQYSQTQAGDVWRDYDIVKVAPNDSFLNSSPASVIPTHTVFYEMIDELVDEFPDYIEKTLLGVDGLDNEIYSYRAKPADYWTRWYPENAPEVLEKPKIILIGATHGNEKSAALTNYYLLRQLCKNWREDERASFLRWGVDIILVPVLNPSGFDLGERRNHNDVDLNRNMPFGWTETNTSGPSPASELETQIILDLFDQHPDAYVIDHHNAGSLNNSEEPYAYWIGTERPETIELARMSCDHMMAYLRREYDYVPQDNSRITRLVDSFNATIAKHVQRELDMNGFTLEGGSGFVSRIDRERHELEALANLVHMCVRQENWKRVRETFFEYT